ncbi:reverse transcriptase family protein [Sediminibacterium sp.]|uniref:reverse transcriptase family protein n=1 Tax=Sediminibacterium sp. TaxID=1917865 RepID=UPI003F713394
MKLEQKHIDHIKSAFAKMQTKEDLLNLLNEVKPLIYGDKTVPFQLKQLTWYANPKVSGERYKEFKIKKKSGLERSIHAPVKGLKALQKTLALILQAVYEPHNAAMGFVRGRSVVDNARLHVGARYVYNIDLKDFFPSIDQARVWKCLQLRPFNLVETGIKIEIQTFFDKIVDFELFSKYYVALEIKNQKILEITYTNINLIKGWHNLLLKSGESVIYYIKKDVLKHNETLSLYLDRSSYKSVVEFIEKNTPEKKDDKVHLYMVLLQLIFNDQVRKLNKNNRAGIVNIIAAICCTDMEVERKTETGEWEKVKRSVLPQGAPTSPVITNIVCQRLDYLLSGVAKRFGLKYSRYADDITFSSLHNVYQAESDFLKELHRIITEQNFHIKESKTRLQKDGYRKEVTGLLVNEKANVQQRYIKQLRMWLYYWERYGYERASHFFLKQYISDRGHCKDAKPEMINVISGKLDYLKMVKGNSSYVYLELKERFYKLTQQKPEVKPRKSHLLDVIDLLFKKGLDVAMSTYKPTS